MLAAGSSVVRRVEPVVLVALGRGRGGGHVVRPAGVVVVVKVFGSVAALSIFHVIVIKHIHCACQICMWPRSHFGCAAGEGCSPARLRLTLSRLDPPRNLRSNSCTNEAQATKDMARHRRAAG